MLFQYRRAVQMQLDRLLNRRVALVDERFFPNLNEDLLPCPEQFRNGRPGFWRISVCPMFLLLDRGRATSASASAPAGRTVGEMVIVGTIRYASARRPFISLLELFIFLGLLC